MQHLMSSEELASKMGYRSVSGHFRAWLGQLNITPVPGRRGYFDPILVRRRLDEAQGLRSGESETPCSNSGEMLLAERRARRAQN